MFKTKVESAVDYIKNLDYTNLECGKYIVEGCERIDVTATAFMESVEPYDSDKDIVLFRRTEERM